MKTNHLFTVLKSFALILLMGLYACEGDIGPVGPAGPAGSTGAAGPAGPVGPAGANGADGQDGTTNCIECHGNSQLIAAKMFQWENSVHATGGLYARNAASCAACHTSQGFLDRIASGEQSASEATPDPLPQNCYTCHQIHSTYTYNDWALTASDPVTFWQGGETVDLGESNLCINCHQARVSPIPEPGVVGTTNITSRYWGPHHGSQGVLFTGSSAYEVGDGYENSAHTTIVADACIACHMAPVSGGRASGGHTFRVESESGSLNTNGCVVCHSDSDALNLLTQNTQTTIEDLLHELETLLFEQGIIDGNGYAITGEIPNVHAGALWNFKYVEEDRSYGVHNYKYAKKLLENTIASLQ